MKRIMHVQFWGDVRRQAGSVDKVLAAFARMDEPDLAVEVASLGAGVPEPFARATAIFFGEDRLKNKIFNKILGLGAFTFSELVALIEERRPDLLHIHNRHGLVDRLVARLSYRPIVLCHFHRKFGEFVLPKRIDGAVTVSGAVRDGLVAACAPAIPVDVIYNPVPLELAGANAGGEAKEPNRKPRLLYGGGRQRNKGFFELEAALQSPELADGFEVVFCGPELDGYAPPFPASVRGQLPSAEFLRELERCDILAMPSHHEGFSILALEALALGKLIVATQGGGLAEIFDASNALIHGVGDVAGLTGCLSRARVCCLDPQGAVREELRRACLATAARFSPEAINRDLAALYRRYLNIDEPN